MCVCFVLITIKSRDFSTASLSSNIFIRKMERRNYKRGSIINSFPFFTEESVEPVNGLAESPGLEVSKNLI